MIVEVQDCPNLSSYDKTVVCSSDGNSGDLSNYEVPGDGVVIQILWNIKESP